MHLTMDHEADFREALDPTIAISEWVDYYEEALQVVERGDLEDAVDLEIGMPTVGLSVDRRVLAHVAEAYDEDTLKCHICFVCAQKCLYHKGFDRKGTQTEDLGDIQFHKVAQLQEKIKRNKHISLSRKKNSTYYIGTVAVRRLRLLDIYRDNSFLQV